jgi:carbon starvation protein CstA
VTETSGTPRMTGGSFEQSGLEGPGPAPLSFFLHTVVAMIVSPMIVFVVLIFLAVSSYNNSSHINLVLNAGGVANPLLWGPGLILGLLVNRFVLRRTACWVWLVGMAWMAFGTLESLSTYRARFLGICSPFDRIASGFFSYRAYCGDAGNATYFTLPMFSAIAYSLGAWVALRLGRRRELKLC